MLIIDCNHQGRVCCHELAPVVLLVMFNFIILVIQAIL